MKIKLTTRRRRLRVKNQFGVAALLTVIVVGAAALIMAYSASILGLGELEMGYTSQRGAETLSVADGCMEEALRRVRLDTSYGGETLNLGDGSCIISVGIAGDDRTVTVTANIDEEYYKKIEAGLSLDGNVITINSWEELSS